MFEDRNPKDLCVLARNLSKSFGKVRAVQRVDIIVPKGEFYGFLGPNGAGKSTTIKMLVGLLRMDTGEVWINGYNLKKDPIKVKGSIGVMLEEPNLYERLTGWEYLNFAGRMYSLSDSETERRARELIILMDLADAENKVIGDYSLGMRKKIALATALIHNPSLLFLDEPFSGIDPMSSKRIKDVLLRLVARGSSIFFTSHVLEVVERLCTSYSIIHSGKIVHSSTKEEVTRSGKTLEEIFIEKVGEEAIAGIEMDWLG